MTTLDSAPLRASRRPLPGPTRTEHVVRADDQLRLTIELLNLDVDPATNLLVRVDDQEDFTGVRLVLGSQHTVESTISTAGRTPAEGADHRTARDSRIVYPLPEGTPYALGALLDLAARALDLDDRAVPGDPTTALDVEPSPDVTALEVVESLVFSPDPGGRFTAAATPITRDGVTELWRARLEPGRRTPDVRPKLYAIWSRPGDPPRPFVRPLPQDQRAAIVAATVTDTPLEVERLWLTSQGSFLDLRGEWASGSLAGYLHRSTAGRDVYVEVTERGYLAPFGHPASITTVTERQFRPDPDGEPTAILVQDDYLAVSDATVTFPAPHMPHEGRAIPFPAVTVLDTGTGPVEREAISLADGTAIDTENAWVVTRGGADALVSYSATDRTGRSDITFTMPAIFVTDRHAYTVQDVVNGVRTPLANLNTYFDEAPAARVEPDLAGQPIGWATPHPQGTAGSDRGTRSIRISLDRPVLDGGLAPAAVRAELEEAGRPAFYPRVAQAFVVDETTSALLGGDGSPILVRYADAWLADGNEAGNPGLAFHTLAEPTTVERSGAGSGLVKPALNVTTFSQTIGAGPELGGGTALTGGPLVSWDPTEALGDAAKLFGTIALNAIIDGVNVALDQLEGERGMPRFEVLLEEDGIHYLMTWEPKLKTLTIGDEPVFVVDKDSGASLRLDQLVPIDSSTAAGTEFELVLDNVMLRLPPAVPAVEIDFKRVRYFEPRGGTSSLESELNDWRFIEVLAFLEPVRQTVVTLLDLGNVEVGPEGVFADVEIPVPSLAFGVLGVTNLTIGLVLDLPNSDPAKVGFNLSRRSDPFAITIMGFGGTGSFELQLVADDIDYLHASLAAAYELAVSIVVVSASLRAALGIDLTYDGEQVAIGAYVELSANASVLGLVNLTGKVLLALRYELESKLLKGRATLSAEVDSLFGKSETTWTETVEVSLGSSSDQAALRAEAATPEGTPSFVDRFPAADLWTTYCLAFADPSKGDDPLGPPPRALQHPGARAEKRN